MNPFLEEENSYDVAVEAMRSGPKRTGLVRMNATKPTASSDGRTMEGYFAVFGVRAKIDSPAESPVPFWETMAGGSLTRTVKAQQGKLKLLFNHGFDPSIGKKPLGPITALRADKLGGWVAARISDTSYGNDILQLISDGAIDGMSFRANVDKDEWTYPTFKEAKKGALPERIIREASLDSELGPVTFPAYEATTVGVRSGKDFEEWEAANPETREQIRELLRDATDPVATVRAIDTANGYTAYGSTPDTGLAEQDPEDPDPALDGHHSTATMTKRERLKVARIACVRARGVKPHEDEEGSASSDRS
jgi:hypothetical protein